MSVKGTETHAHARHLNARRYRRYFTRYNALQVLAPTQEMDSGEDNVGSESLVTAAV